MKEEQKERERKDEEQAKETLIGEDDFFQGNELN